MKFGDTIYQRSVPKWAAYNVNYNEIKRLIKERTSQGLAVPVSIPNGSSNNRWLELEDELFAIIQDQYNNVSLFLKSKYGEIDRRLNYLEKQVRSAKKASELSYTNPSLPERRYHKLGEDAESIGQDVQNLTRFAGVQKTAVRKILKKYRKWTGSTSLQTRLENEVFSTGQLGLDYAYPLERLAAQRTTIKELQKSLLRNQTPAGDENGIDSSVTQPVSTVEAINAANKKGPVALDAALATIPFGKSSGSASYWIHPDNLDEAQALLLRHVYMVHKDSNLSRDTSELSIASVNSRAQSSGSETDGTHIAYFDNPQRFAQDSTANRPSKVALSARWCRNPEATITLSNLAPWNPSGTIVDIKRRDVSTILGREDRGRQLDRKRLSNSNGICRVQEYLSEHRDVKPLAKVMTSRSRYVGNVNSSKVGTWAVLDSDIVISPFNKEDVGSEESQNDQAENGEAFPYSVLKIRWEFSHTPEVVRAFDTTHLAERVQNFSLESAAIHTANKQLPSPSWKPMLEKDIRRVPITSKMTAGRRGSFNRRGPIAGTSSGTSSTDGPTDSVFSTANERSSIASLTSPDASTRDLTSSLEVKPSTSDPPRKKKKARIDAQSPPPRASRYWNEFDDGDEDVNPEEVYTIYINPDEPIFPGADKVAHMFSAMYTSLGEVGSRVTSIFSLKSRSPTPSRNRGAERSRLLTSSSRSNSDDPDSSDSDTTPIEESIPGFGTFPGQKLQSQSYSPTPRPGSSSLYRPNQILTPRQQALERTYFFFYCGLLVLAYVLLFISGVLISTGRKKAYLEVELAVISGIAAAEICAMLAIILLCMRRQRLSIIHKGVVHVAIIGIFVIGIGEIVGIVRRKK